VFLWYFFHASLFSLAFGHLVGAQPLRDIYGPSTERAHLRALIVSEETRAGGAMVNARRAENGMAPCEIVVIPLVDNHGTGGGGDSSSSSSSASVSVAAAASAKISSTDMRKWRARAELVSSLARGSGDDGSSSSSSSPSSPSLHGAWSQLTADLALPPALANETWQALVSRYTEPHRAYHSLAHIAQLLEVFALHTHAGAGAQQDHALKPNQTVRDSVAVRLAIWFHDLVYSVYDPVASSIGAADDEERSAVDFLEFAARAELPHALVCRVVRMIMGTKRHIEAIDACGAIENEDERIDTRLFLQLDLAVLGADAGAYDAYADAIRFECARVAPAAFSAGRRRVLGVFAERAAAAAGGGLFPDLVDGAQRNLRAAENLAREAAALS
jgi:predicted metal-dependent HD superfamily phosphohydrolase